MYLDKISLGAIREHKEKKEEQKNPNAKLVRLINQFHSVDNKDHLDAEQRQQQKNSLYREIMEHVEKTNPNAKGRIKYLLQDPNIWEKERNKF